MNSDPSKPSCTVCSSRDAEALIRIESIPVFCNVLLSSEEEARSVAKGDLDLFFCQHCGHIFNASFDEALVAYNPSYENSLFFSERFRAYAHKLAQHLIDRYDLREKQVIEIACGKGDFLRLLCDLGNNRGVGFDPSYEPGRNDAHPRIRFVQDYYAAAYKDVQGDLICCRHALEHIPMPTGFLADIRQAADGNADSVVFFEVPNALYTLRDLGIWDLLYEHCSYFTDASLRHAFSAAGFKVLDVRTAFNEQFLCLEARLSNAFKAHETPERGELDMIRSYAHNFQQAFQEKVHFWDQQLNSWAADGKKAVIWGGGTKGVMVSNILAAGERIPHVVDLNPHKHDRYVPGTGQRIVSPEFLKEYRPDRVIVMNAVYEEEIRRSLLDMGIDAELLTA
jgi:hypothetical protein